MTQKLYPTPYTIYYPDGSETLASIDWPFNPGYEVIRDLVEPLVDGPMEHVSVLKPGGSRGTR